MKNIFFLLFIIINLGVFSQEKTRMLLSLDRKNSLFSDAKVNTWGVRLGFKYGCKINFGMGVYTARNIEFDYRLNALQYPNASTSSYAKISYVTVFAEPIILAEKRKVFSIPVSVGGGSLKVKYRELNSTKKETYFSDFVPVLDVSGVFMFKLVPFVWIGGGIGYRHFFHKDDFVNEYFNSPYYMIKLKIGRPCKKASAFYKWRKNLFNDKDKSEDKKDKKDKEGKK